MANYEIYQKLKANNGGLIENGNEESKNNVDYNPNKNGFDWKNVGNGR
eukprot:CAMPEP_0114599936 /NCGR_PEP_ID=MMETSP0125-20121206/22433_1 /TAXON_ID=485358 ORGANISM="Aristerostoma sp., Strain ATCC 50986" /NCGR_SAMPLE_ID=MMETSP0125 /ASSEMBLY_ACC=CAM_ASM_000245 /LENGTH=47 /DNA_ID= /DNA_START= /DNA_END= /DNA_ORIENTATION=